MNKSHLLMGAAAFAVAISVTQPAFAQETPAAAADCLDANGDGVCDSDETTGRGSDIVVTGSRIPQTNLITDHGRYGGRNHPRRLQQRR